VTLFDNVVILFVHELRATGKTQQAISDVVGVPRETVRDALAEKPVMTEKTAKKRERVVYQLTNYTKPEVAAERFASTWANVGCWNGR
jgi:hypothetical protein